MSLLKEIQANAAVAWSPIRKRPGMLALGSKGDTGVGFENTGGEFKLVSADFSDPILDMTTIHSIKTPSRFTSLSWREVLKHKEKCPYGIVAGGMSDGMITLWNPKAMEEKGDLAACEVGKITRHKGSVNDIQFNPHDDSSHLLASGGSDGEVYIMSLEKLTTPAVFTPSGGSLAQGQVNEITSVAWNTQVNYILATGSQNGSVVIWDLKQKKPWCELRDPQRGTVSTIVWNPREGLQIATASGDDQRPVIKLWDLRNSTTTPLAEFHEHSAGVLSVSWCPNDPGLVLSCAKDNRTLLWDLFSRQSMFEFPSEKSSAPSLGSDPFFGGGSGQRRWKVQWSPSIPAVASTCTLDGKVQVWGLGAGGNPSCRAPRWIRRPVGASFGFGGKLLVIGNPKEPITANSDRRRLIHLHHVVTEPSVVDDAIELDQSLEMRDFMGLCDRKVEAQQSERSKIIWSLMKILFEKDARQHLLLHLGLDAAKIRQANERFAPKTAATPEPSLSSVIQENYSGAQAEDVFSAAAHTDSEGTSPLNSIAGVAAALPDDESEQINVISPPVYTEKSEATLMEALLVGDFEIAVNCCLHYKQFADALLLASCGGPELWDKTQRAFFEQQKRPVMRIVSAVIKSELGELVQQSDLQEWRQTLAILSTYAKSEEFPLLCDKLAQRLEDAGDSSSATLCYMCAVNVGKTVNAWVTESNAESATIGRTKALQRLVEKVLIFCQAVDQAEHTMTPEVSRCFAEYSALLAAQGRLDIAAKYARFSDLECAILRDRIYHAAPQTSYQAPPFPFEVFNIPSVQHYQQQQAQYQKPSMQKSAAPNQYAGINQPQGVPGAAQGNFAAYGSRPSMPVPPNREEMTSHNAPKQQASYAPQPGYNLQQQQPAYGQQQMYSNQPVPSYQRAPLQPDLSAHPPGPGGLSAAQKSPYKPQQLASPSPSAYSTQQSGYVNQNVGSPMMMPTPAYPGQQPQIPSQPPHMPMSTSIPPSVNYSNDPSFGNASAVPHSTGVNSVAAASLTSSRITVPSVNMSSQVKDGFVSSVGNAELSLKYGNKTSASMATPTTANSAQANTQSEITGSVAPQDLVIVTTFNDFISQLQALPLTIMEQKQVKEIQKATEILVGKLKSNALSPTLLSQLHDMCGCLQQRDFGAAQQIYVPWTLTEWAQHKDWLRGLKGLIQIASKRFR